MSSINIGTNNHPQILCLGELLVDMLSTTRGARLGSAVSFTKAPGGAPANVAVGLARLGVPAGFIGGLSNDELGMWLKSVLIQNNVDINGAMVYPGTQTRLAWIVTLANGDRHLADFSKASCADAQLQANDLKPEMIARASILHFGSISLIPGHPAEEATQSAIELAKSMGLLLSYDPNVRLGLWQSEKVCRETILNSLCYADIVKITDQELEFLTGSSDLRTAAKLRKDHNIPLLLMTMGASGAFLFSKNGSRKVNGFSIKLMEATGAGDSFVATVLSELLSFVKDSGNRRHFLEALPIEQLESIVRRATAAGALACTKCGAIPALPTRHEIDEFLLMEPKIKQVSSN